MSEPTYGASFRRDLDCWVVYEGNGEEELCRCGHDKVGVLLTALRRPPARFTREDVEKAARKLAPHLEGGREFDQMPPTRIDLRKWSREGMCSTNDATQDDAIEAATAALSAIGDVDH